MKNRKPESSDVVMQRALYPAASSGTKGLKKNQTGLVPVCVTSIPFSPVLSLRFLAEPIFQRKKICTCAKKTRVLDGSSADPIEKRVINL